MKMRVSIARALVTRPQAAADGRALRGARRDHPLQAQQRSPAASGSSSAGRWSSSPTASSNRSTCRRRIVVMAARPGPGRGGNRRSTAPTRATRRSAPRAAYNASLPRGLGARCIAPWASERIDGGDRARTRSSEPGIALRWHPPILRVAGVGAWDARGSALQPHPALHPARPALVLQTLIERLAHLLAVPAGDAADHRRGAGAAIAGRRRARRSCSRCRDGSSCRSSRSR